MKGLCLTIQTNKLRSYGSKLVEKKLLLDAKIIAKHLMLDYHIQFSLAPCDMEYKRVQLSAV